MTNEEYISKKIDEEYQKYLKSLKIPSKEEWLKMEHKEEINPKFNIGDIIESTGDYSKYIVVSVSESDKLYWLEDLDDDDGFRFCEEIDYVDKVFRLDDQRKGLIKTHKFNVGDYIRNNCGDKAFLVDVVDENNGKYSLMSLEGARIRYSENIKDIDIEYIFIGKM